MLQNKSLPGEINTTAGCVFLDAAEEDAGIFLGS